MAFLDLIDCRGLLVEEINCTQGCQHVYSTVQSHCFYKKCMGSGIELLEWTRICMLMHHINSIPLPC